MTDDSYTTYGYDDDGQLHSSQGYTSGGLPIAAQQLGFGYDAGWNMTSRSVNGVGTAYTVNKLNQVTADGTTTYAYDANGNLAWKYWTGGYLIYGYDDENRLTSVYDSLNRGAVMFLGSVPCAPNRKGY